MKKVEVNFFDEGSISVDWLSGYRYWTRNGLPKGMPEFDFNRAENFYVLFPEATAEIGRAKIEGIDIGAVLNDNLEKTVADLNLILPPDTQLHTLRIDAGAFDVLKKINTAKLQHLGLLPKKTPQDVSELSRMDFPRLETLLLNLGDRQLQLPRLPNLRHLTIYSAGEIDLQHLQKHHFTIRHGSFCRITFRF